MMCSGFLSFCTLLSNKNYDNVSFLMCVLVFVIGDYLINIINNLINITKC